MDGTARGPPEKAGGIGATGKSREEPRSRSAAPTCRADIPHEEGEAAAA
jgi:hypothetical protein